MNFVPLVTSFAERLVIAVERLAGIGEVTIDGSGWASYHDATYPDSATPLTLVANTPTLLTNDTLGTLTNEVQKPTDIDTFYDAPSNKIVGRLNDAVLVTVEMIVKPTTAGTTYLEVWLDPGLPTGELLHQPFTFPKGNGVERPLTFNATVDMDATWELNNGEVYVEANGAADIYDIRFIFHRIHKAVDV